MRRSFPIEELAKESFFQSGKFVGNINALLQDVIGIKDAPGKNYSQCVSWIHEKNLSHITGPLQLGLLILNSASYETLKHHSCNFLIVENPRLVFQKVLKTCFALKRTPGIEQSAVVHPSVQIPESCYVGHHVVIEEGCRIGNDCEILHHTVLLRETVIGNRVRIGCHCTLGNFGFGYEKNEHGDYELMEHSGTVEVHDDVHIHNNTCIDRAVIGKTIIGENVKIDNLVHIAHGVVIGRNSLIIANAMVAGSTVIGENCWIAPSSSIKNQLHIASDTMTGIAAVVLKDTESRSVIIGNPAVSLDEYKKWSKAKNKLMEDEQNKKSD